MKKTHLFFLLLFIFSSSLTFAADPTIQATNMTIVSRTATSISVSWTRGNGQAVLVSVRNNNNTLAYPNDGYGSDYNPSTNYGSGSILGTGNYVVYNGTGTSVTINNLLANTDYTIYAWEYNETYNAVIDDFYYYYKTTVGSNDASAYTLCTEPTTSTTNYSASSVTYTSATLSWTGGNGSYNLVTVDKSPFSHVAPSDGSTYTSSSVWGSGSVTGGDNYVVANQTNTSISVSNLSSATSYRARIYEYNCTGGQQNYYTGGYVYFDFTTANYPPYINTLSNQTICQDGGQQIVSLSGISDGSSQETQTVSITASSSNTTLIPSGNILVSYTSPSTTGTLYYTPASGQYGTAVITVTANDNFSATNTFSRTFTVTVLPKPGAAGIISGSSTVCAGGGNVTYMEAAISNATGYQWTFPSGWSIVSGQGTQTVTVSPGASAANGIISVYGTNSNGCGNGTSYSKTVSVNQPPTTASAGPDQGVVCNTSTTLSGNIPATGNTGTWSVLPGPPAPVIGNVNTNNTSVAGLSNSQTYYFVWTITNSGVCPASKDTVMVVTDFSNPACTPSANFSYSSNTNSGIANTVCVNTPVQFTDLSVSPDTWDWDFEYTGVFSSNSTLQNPTYTYTATGTYTCRLKIHSNTTGLDYFVSQTITVIGPPSAPSTISGVFTGICAGDPNQYSYSVNTVSNATTYSWTYPTGCSLSTNSSDFSLVSVTYDQTATDGFIQVNAANGCGSSSTILDTVFINEFPGAANSISEAGGSTVFCQGQQGVVFMVPTIANASSYTWTLPSGTSGTSTSNSISVDFSSNALSGNIIVFGSNSCGNGMADTMAITVNPLPSQPGAIGGLTALDVCPMPTAVTYTVAPITNSTSYIWTVAGNITGGNNMDTIVVDFSSNLAPGAITVQGQNACGSGPASSALTYTLNPLTMADLCIVSVDSASNFNEIFWAKPLTGGIDSFRVYRRVSASANTLVGTVSYNDDAYILDVSSGADPNSNFEEYTITTVDTCGNESDSSLFHRTMFLAPPVYGTGSVTLNWNLYIGQTVNFYRIWRDTTGTGTAWEIVDASVNPGVTTWVDNNLPATANATLLYRVDVDWLTSCDPSRAIINTSRSNVKSQMINPSVGISIADISNEISVYPNPAKDQVTVQLKTSTKNSVTELVDVLGQVVISERQQSNDRVTLNTSSLAAGVYFVRISGTDFKGIKKLVIER